MCRHTGLAGSTSRDNPERLSRGCVPEGSGRQITRPPCSLWKGRWGMAPRRGLPPAAGRRGDSRVGPRRSGCQHWTSSGQSGAGRSGRRPRGASTYPVVERTVVSIVHQGHRCIEKMLGSFLSILHAYHRWEFTLLEYVSPPGHSSTIKTGKSGLKLNSQNRDILSSFTRSLSPTEVEE